MKDFVAWVQLFSTVGLLVVTYWYARTTKSLADSARVTAAANQRATEAAERSAGAAERSAEENRRATEAAERSAQAAERSAEESRRATGAAERSAEAAERSAEASLDAATVAQSQIKPDFTGRVIALAAPESDEEHVACLRIDSAGDAVVVQRVRIRRAFRRSFDEGRRDVAITDSEMTPAGLDSHLPKRMHFGEHLLVTHPSMQVGREDPFTRFIIDIEYTFSESGQTGATKELIIDA